MKFIHGKRSGNSAETSLTEMLKTDRNKLSYVNSLLSKFSHYMHMIVEGIEEVKLRKYLLELHKNNVMGQISQSNLNDKEVNFLRNAVKARYMNLVRDLKLPLN